MLRITNRSKVYFPRSNYFLWAWAHVSLDQLPDPPLLRCESIPMGGLHEGREGFGVEIKGRGECHVKHGNVRRIFQDGEIWLFHGFQTGNSVCFEQH
jgi:hypothetical protein